MEKLSCGSKNRLKKKMKCKVSTYLYLFNNVYSALLTIALILSESMGEYILIYFLNQTAVGHVYHISHNSWMTFVVSFLVHFLFSRKWAPCVIPCITNKLYLFLVLVFNGLHSLLFRSYFLFLIGRRFFLI